MRPRWMSYGQYRRYCCDPRNTVRLFPLLKLGNVCLVLVRERR